MQSFTTKTIREIALEAPATTRVFEDLKIDYCCGGRKLFTDACADAGVDPGDVAARIAAVFASNNDEPAVESASQLIDHIIGKHHLFTAQEVERLTPLMAKVCRRHGDQHPELFELQKVFDELAASLIPHMGKEEMVLFPFIRTLEKAKSEGLTIPASHFGTVANPIRMMMADHDVDGDRLRRMREIARDYALPEGACPSFNALYAGLQDLERDLHRHIHLENNVLFPAATDLESSVLGMSLSN